MKIQVDYAPTRTSGHIRPHSSIKAAESTHTFGFIPSKGSCCIETIYYMASSLNTFFICFYSAFFVFLPAPTH